MIFYLFLAWVQHKKAIFDETVLTSLCYKSAYQHNLQIYRIQFVECYKSSHLTPLCIAPETKDFWLETREQWWRPVGLIRKYKQCNPLKLIKYLNKKTETFYTNTSTLNLGCQPEAYLPRSCILLTLPL